MKSWLIFVGMTILCWGAYIPTMHAGQNAIGGKDRSLWAFLFVGIAYCVVAVAGPLLLLWSRGGLSETPPGKGMWIATFAGVLGAVGAFGILLALLYGGTPKSVPPLVFAGAPIMSTFVAMAMHPPKTSPSPLFYVGILLAAGGAALVLRYKPA